MDQAALKLTSKEEEKERELSIVRALLYAREANSHLLPFTKHTYPKYQVNWHHQIICQKLTDFVSGKIKNLMIFMPPRNGKSELVSKRLPAFALGVNPDEQIIATSYGAELASKANREVQRIIDSERYRQIFPGTTLSGKNVATVATGAWLRNSQEFEVVNHRGYYKSAGIGGSITGRGFTMGLIDDPIKNREQADSVTYREMIWDWYLSTFYTRKEGDKARILITLTRWHEDDLAGRLLKLAKKDPKADQWEVIKFPAIMPAFTPGEEVRDYDLRSEGEALWEYKYPIEELQSMKATMGSREWNALMQQNPQTEGGNIVDRNWWKYYKTRPTKFDEVVHSWDMAFAKTEDSSYVVGTVWGRIGASKYLLDLVRDRMSFTESIRAVKTLSAKWPEGMRKLVENKANGTAVIDSLKLKIPGLIAVEPNGSKEARAHAVSPEMEAGNVFLPESAPWLHDYLQEWSNFPNSADNDQVDSTTQALLYFRKKGIGSWGTDEDDVDDGSNDNDDNEIDDKIGEY